MLPEEKEKKRMRKKEPFRYGCIIAMSHTKGAGFEGKRAFVARTLAHFAKIHIHSIIFMLSCVSIVFVLYCIFV